MDDKEFTKDWFSHNIPLWRRQLAALQTRADRINMLEIGSYEGRSACWLMEHTAPYGELECIDPWTDDEIKQRFLKNTERYRMSGRLQIDQSPSSDALAERLLYGKKYDFIYIDGNHEGAVALFDAVMSFRLVKVGGLICFDDYVHEHDDLHILPSSAVNAFLTLHQPFIEIRDKSHQVWVKKHTDLPEVSQLCVPTDRRRML